MLCVINVKDVDDGKSYGHIMNRSRIIRGNFSEYVAEYIALRYGVFRL